MTGAASLPRGRHQLSHEYVVGTQRARILHALAETMTESGYVNTPVAAVLKRAGVSRETFYQQFSSKQDCFTAALEEAISHLAATLGDQVQTPEAPLPAFDRLLAAYFHTLAEDPATAWLFLVETYAAGHEAMQRRLALQSQFVDSIAALFGAKSKPDRFGCEVLVAAVISMVTARFVRDDVAGLDDLRTPLVELAGRLISRS